MDREYNYKIIGTKVTVLGDWLKLLVEETDIYILYIYRDIRDVLLSAKNRFARYDVTNFIIRYKSDINSALSLQSNRLFLLKYEDFILDTDTVVKQLSEFLGIDINRDIEIAKDRNTDWLDNSAFHDITQLFDENACYRWRKYRESKEVKYSEILASDMMKRLGYYPERKRYKFVLRLAAYQDLYMKKFRNFGISIIKSII
jgi:hypothetical protein